MRGAAAGATSNSPAKYRASGCATLMRGARAFVFAAEEDFGIAPVEAQACGTPVIAYAARRRGRDDPGTTAQPSNRRVLQRAERRGNRRRHRSVRAHRACDRRRQPAGETRCAFRSELFRRALCRARQRRADARVRSGPSECGASHAERAAQPTQEQCVDARRAGAHRRPVDHRAGGSRRAAGSYRTGSHGRRPRTGSPSSPSRSRSLFVFPAVGLYRPQRGASIVEDVARARLGLADTARAGRVPGVRDQDQRRVFARLGRAVDRRRLPPADAACASAAPGAALAAPARLQPAPYLHRRRRRARPRGRAAPAPRAVERAAVCAASTTIRRSSPATSVDGVPVLGTHRRVCTATSIAATSTRCGSRCRCAPRSASGSLVIELRAHPVQVRYVPDIFGFQLLRHSFSEVAGMPVIGLTDTPMQGVQRVLKAVEDYVLRRHGAAAALAGAAADRDRHQAHFTRARCSIASSA